MEGLGLRQDGQVFINVSLERQTRLVVFAFHRRLRSEFSAKRPLAESQITLRRILDGLEEQVPVTCLDARSTRSRRVRERVVVLNVEVIALQLPCEPTTGRSVRRFKPVVLRSQSAHQAFPSNQPYMGRTWSPTYRSTVSAACAGERPRRIAFRYLGRRRRRYECRQREE